MTSNTETGIRCGCTLTRGDKVKLKATKRMGSGGTLYAICVDGKGNEVVVPFDSDLAVSPVNVAPPAHPIPATTAATPSPSLSSPASLALPHSKLTRAASSDVPPTVPLRGVSGRGSHAIDGQNKDAKRGYVV